MLQLVLNHHNYVFVLARLIMWSILIIIQIMSYKTNMDSFLFDHPNVCSSVMPACCLLPLLLLLLFCLWKKPLHHLYFVFLIVYYNFVLCLQIILYFVCVLVLFIFLLFLYICYNIYNIMVDFSWYFQYFFVYEIYENLFMKKNQLYYI